MLLKESAPSYLAALPEIFPAEEDILHTAETGSGFQNVIFDTVWFPENNPISTGTCLLPKHCHKKNHSIQRVSAVMSFVDS